MKTSNLNRDLVIPIMRFSLSYILIAFLTVSLTLANSTNGQGVLKRKLTLRVQNERFEKVLDQIERTVDVRFLYLSGIVEQSERISLNLKNESLSEALRVLFYPLKIGYEIDGEYIILTKSQVPKTSGSKEVEDSQEERLRVQGRVLDNDGLPVPGATVLLKGSSIGTITDVTGNFVIEVDSEEAVLVFSFIGFQTMEVPLNGRQSLEVKLQLDVKSLEEVVVVGYGTQKKSDLIGAISTVDGADLNLKSVSNFDAALQGMAAGVSVLSQSGKPGSPSTIKIRGANSIQSSTDPLWVVDGMPIYSTPTGLGSSNQNPMSLMNPNDIESIQVLKDAAATSIYGSRGSNGVILVTTKSGKKGKSQTTISYSTGLSDLTRTPADVGYVNSEEWFQAMDIAYNNSLGRAFRTSDYYQRQPTAFDQIGRDDITEQSINTNWFEESFRQGSFQDVNVSSSKGFDRGSFYLSGNYRTDKGVLNHNQLDRISLRSNLSFEPVKNMTVSAKLSFAYTNNERRNDDLTTVTRYSLPWIPVYHPDDDQRYFNPYTTANIVAKNDPKNTLNNVKQYRALGNLSLNYVLPINGLSLRTELSTDIIQSNLVFWQSRNIRLDGGQSPSTFAEEEAITYRSVNYNLYPTYARKFGTHSINVMVGSEAQRISQYERTMAGEGLTGTYQEIGTPKTLLSINGGLDDERYLLGFFGRVNYNWNDRYLLGFSARRDGSSAFTEDYRWGNFFALSGGWVLSEESFVSDLAKGLYLKLRGSYGETGNQNIPNNLQAVNYYQQGVYGSRQLGSNGTVPTNLPATDLTWETTRSADFGLDYGLLHDRINGTIGYYQRNIDGMLLQTQLPSSAGVSPSDVDFRFLSERDGRETNVIWSNIGNMRNEGVEFELYTVNIDKTKFKWTSGFNITLNDNVIKNLTPELDHSGQGMTTAYTISKNGNRRNLWYVSDYWGVDSETGIPYVYALDQEHFQATGETIRLRKPDGSDSLLLATRTNVEDNRFIQGNKGSDPTFFGGLTNRFEWSGFDLSVFVSFSGGSYILDYDRQVSVYPNESRMLLREALTDSWKFPGDEAKYPKLVRGGTMEVDGRSIRGFDDDNVYHNRELYKSDFVRLRNVTLGYNLKPQALERMNLQGLRVHISANNLLTFTDYPGFDPEGTLDANGAHLLQWNTPIPQLKSFIMGIDIKI